MDEDPFDKNDRAERERRKRNIALALALGGVGDFVLSDVNRAMARKYRPLEGLVS